ncbi:MAG: tetratricopeptide repeat protein [Myxococcota bacterium]
MSPARIVPLTLAVVLLLALGSGSFGCANFRGARLYQTGSAALERGETERAIGDLERAARLVPHASEVHNHLGLAYAQAGRDGEALGAFERAVALDCDNTAAAHNLELWSEEAAAAP